MRRRILCYHLKTNLKSIMEKLHVENHVQAVAWARREGLVTKQERP